MLHYQEALLMNNKRILILQYRSVQPNKWNKCVISIYVPLQRVRLQRRPNVCRNTARTVSKGIFLFNPSIPDAPNWRILGFEKRLHETETS